MGQEGGYKGERVCKPKIVKIIQIEERSELRCLNEGVNLEKIEKSFRS